MNCPTEKVGMPVAYSVDLRSPLAATDAAHPPWLKSPGAVDCRERRLRRVVRRLNDSDLPTLRVVNTLLLGVVHLHAAWTRPRSAARASPAR